MLLRTSANIMRFERYVRAVLSMLRTLVLFHTKLWLDSQVLPQHVGSRSRYFNGYA